MSTEPDAPALQTLRRIGTTVRTLAALGALLLAVLPLWLWTSAERVEAHARHALGVQGPLALTPAALWAHAALALPGLALGFFLLWQLWQLFGEYRGGRVFTRRAVKHLRRFALGVLAAGLASPLGRTAGVLALTWGNPPGQRQLLVSLSSDDYLHLLLGAVLLAIARVMAEGVRLAEENAQFV